MGRGLSADSRTLIQRAYDVLAVEFPSGVRRVAYALFGNQADDEVKKLGRLLTWARKHELIPWEWITDETRPERLPFVVSDATALRDCHRACPHYDPWQFQPVRIKVWSEKSVAGTLAPVLDKYLVPFQVHHGNTSTSIIRQAAVSTREDARKLVILGVGDHDPKGVRITEDDVPKRLREYGADMTNVSIRRLALLREDAIRLKDLRDPFKENDTDITWYKKHARLNYGVELEAMPSPELRNRLEQAIRDEIRDIGAWNAVINASNVVRESWQTYVDRWQAPPTSIVG